MGPYLGNLTSEIPADYKGKELIVAGAKSYFLKMVRRVPKGDEDDVKTIQKIKGLSLHSAARAVVTEDVMRETVQPLVSGAAVGAPVMVPQHQILCRSRVDQTVVSKRKCSKKF